MSGVRRRLTGGSADHLQGRIFSYHYIILPSLHAIKMYDRNWQIVANFYSWIMRFWPYFLIIGSLDSLLPRAWEECFKYEVGLALIHWKNVEIRILGKNSVQFFVNVLSQNHIQYNIHLIIIYYGENTHPCHQLSSWSCTARCWCRIKIICLIRRLINWARLSVAFLGSRSFRSLWNSLIVSNAISGSFKIKFVERWRGKFYLNPANRSAAACS